MDLSTYTNKKTRAYTSEQLLATEIYEFFHRELAFPMIMKFIKTKGERAIYFLFNEVKKSDFPYKKELFMKKVREEKVKLSTF